MDRKKILLVDDSPVILKALSFKLKSAGYEVITAADGGTAVGAVRTQKPDLILLDINFEPDVAHGGGVSWDGFLIMDWLKRMDQAKGIPVIVVTGGEAEKNRARALAAGAVGFFRKPVEPEELIKAIEQVLAGGSEPTPPA